MEILPKHQSQRQKVTLSFDSHDTYSKERIEKKKYRGKDKTWEYLSKFGELGFYITVPIAGGAIAGSFIDRTFALYPKATLLLLFGGVIVSFYIFYKLIRDL